ncbi:hypothetical protein PSHT_16241 [Puccinia striiformis]|uniref:Uncharacterized protein n=1 Tax=Puccinia striiformis TaxID=27350 RepID=A0A2S4UAV3_9BASI|nr:hypothetical protein PSHT_16241 [Puccinia striiformis]
MTKFLKMMMIKELTQANLDTDHMNLILKVMEGWTRKIGHGVEEEFEPNEQDIPPQEAPQDLKGLAGFLQVHLGILFPAWIKSVGVIKQDIHLNVQSIVGNELANPIVAQHLEFYPHDPRGKDVFALYQSQKWREELGPNSRVQMVPSEGKHFYIYEPVGLKDPRAPIVVPIFFYKYQNTLFSKCIKPKGGLRANAPAGSRQFDLHLPSIIPWFHPDLIEIPVDQFKRLLRTYNILWGFIC